MVHAHAADIKAMLSISATDFNPKCSLIGRYLEKTKSYSPLRLVVELCLLELALQLLLENMLALSPWGASYEKFYHAHKSMMMMPGVWILAILVAPVFETALCQWIPIRITSLFTSQPRVLVIVSATLFALWHGNICHAVMVFPAGLIPWLGIRHEG